MQQQQGGPSSQYADMTSFAAQRHQQQLMQQQQHRPADAAVAAEAASPISSRPPPAPGDELGPVAGGFPDEESLAGEEAERGLSGNRWPRQETLALLKIRSDMDAVFRDATLKGPLWEEVSRKLAQLGYNRTAKKCKEKFENVHKYYKRTKEGRAGRQDGKSYRFFSQLEALHSSSSAGAGAPNPTQASAAPPSYLTLPAGPSSSIPAAAGPSSSRIQPLPAAAAITQTGSIQRIGPDLSVEPPSGMPGSAAEAAVSAGGISFSSNTSSDSASDSEDDEMEDLPLAGSRKRKRSGGMREGSSRKMMAFFEGLMRQVMEKQEAMQQRFLDAIEKREQDRMIREEAWRRQEMARLNREHEILAQERAMAASRDAAIISFLQKLTGQTVQIPQLVAITPVDAAAAVAAHPPAQPPQHSPHSKPEQSNPHTPPPPPPPQQQLVLFQQTAENFQQHQVPQSTDLVVVQPEQQLEMVSSSFDHVSSSRWPKAEVLALIELRSGLEPRYQEAGPKGPLWEEISAAMQRMGYNRSAKRCKEKWENINKYFKKVKESNKKRPEDAKTCPYFHQLDALYKMKILGGGAGGSSSSNATTLSIQNKQEQEINPTANPQQRTELLAIMPSLPHSNPPQAPPTQQPQAEPAAGKKEGNSDGGSSSSQVQTGNGGGFPPGSFSLEGPLKKKTL